MVPQGQTENQMLGFPYSDFNLSHRGDLLIFQRLTVILTFDRQD